MKNKIAVAFYLITIIIANLVVTSYGMVELVAGISVVHITAFLLIAPDFTLRDYLHDNWKLNWKKNMFLLILVGGILTFLLNSDSSKVALASTLAFSAAAVVDSIVYHLMRRYNWIYKANVSNIFSTITDSVIFLSIAFGFSLMPILLQISAKFLGAFVWSLILNRKKEINYVS